MADENEIVAGMGKEATGGKEAAQVKYWLKELQQAEKREESYRKLGAQLTRLYECGKTQPNTFNILFSNTETLNPAVYNNLPRPVVKRRFNDADPVARLSAQVCQRVLRFLVQNDDRDYTPFDDLMQQAVLEALVPGRGITEFKYDADIDRDESGEPSAVQYETVCGEETPWNHFLMGYAKRWKDVPWIAFEKFMTREEVAENFGKEIATKIQLTAKGETNDETEQEESAETVPDLARIFKIWSKKSKTVIYISDGYKDGLLKETPDPLNLVGFYPVPQPLRFIAKISTLLPTPLYEAYREQAEELNRVSRRINKIIAALKVRGFYFGGIDGLDKLMTSEDNTLLPLDKQGIGLQDVNDINKSIWLFPVEKLVLTLQQLYVQRDQTKQVIYELTGISDIIRGSSIASETATAQGLKDKWGTLRLKRMQKSVQKYVVHSLRIMAEIAFTKLSQQTIASMTGLQLPTQGQKAQMQQVAQQAAAAGQQLPPEIQKTLQTPTWEEVLALLKDDFQRNYRVDVETNSTVDAEATEDKSEMAELLNAIAQFLSGVGPMVEKGIMPFEAAKTILLMTVRRYRAGDEVEEQIQMMQPPQQQGQDPKAAAEAQKMQQEMQMQQQEAEMKKQQADLDFQVKQKETQLKMQELALKEQQMLAEFQLTMQKLELQKVQIAAQAAMPQQTGPEKGDKGATV